MSAVTEKNAIIKSVRLSNDEHGVMAAWLYLDYGGSGQGFGGYCLYNGPVNGKMKPGDGNYAGHFIWRCLEIGGVTEWNDLPGKTIRVRADHSGVEAIGHIVKDDWFCPRNDFAAKS